MTPEGRAVLDALRQEVPVKYLPWGGRSPRVLTKAYQRFTLRDATATIEEIGDWDEELIEEQNRRFLNGS